MVEIQGGDNQKTRPSRAEYLRKWRAENPEKDKAYAKQYRQRHPEVGQHNNALYYERHPGKLAESRQRRQRRRIESGKSRLADKARKHGKNWQLAYAELWEAQEGCCYLCGDALREDSPQSVVFDHDHRCCPQRRSCALCRRGLACGRCNKLVGLADEDPDRLFRIATALAAASAKAAGRMAARPAQEAMF